MESLTEISVDEVLTGDAHTDLSGSHYRLPIMSRELLTRYDKNTIYEDEQYLLDIFLTRRLKEDVYCRKITIIGTTDTKVFYQVGGTRVTMYEKGSKVSATQTKYIPCNLEYFLCKYVNGAFQFYWK